MVKYILRKQVKLSQHGSPVRTQHVESTHSRIDTTLSDNQFIDVSQESDTDCRDSIYPLYYGLLFDLLSTDSHLYYGL